MLSRRNFIKTSSTGLMGLGAMSSFSSLFAREQSAAALANSSPSPHFIFLRNSNGTFPSFLTPLSLSAAEKSKEAANEALDLDLNKHDLQDWMEALNPYKKNMTLIQGMSAKMCTMGHATYQSPLALCKATERPSTIVRASVDVELGRMFPTPFEHIEFTCAANKTGIVTGYSSIGPNQPNFAFASPRAAYENLFRAGSAENKVIADVELENSMYSFLSRRSEKMGERLSEIESKQKIGNYVTSIDSLTERNKKMHVIADKIRKFTPTLSENVMAGEYTTVEQHDAFADILLGAMGAGLCNSFTITLDNLETKVSGILESEIGLHKIGHDEPVDGVAALEVRKKIRHQHVMVIDKLVQGLKKIPEGKGNMFDNTIIMYFPENGERHHSSGIEEPFVILAGDNAKVNFHGRYIRMPYHNRPGHKTLGNFYTTLLNGYGNPIKHFGDLDMGLKFDQKGPIREFMV
jgi:Protein of unknown function (DUF1552)